MCVISCKCNIFVFFSKPLIVYIRFCVIQWFPFILLYYYIWKITCRLKIAKYNHIAFITVVSETLLDTLTSEIVIWLPKYL